MKKPVLNADLRAEIDAAIAAGCIQKIPEGERAIPLKAAEEKPLKVGEFHCSSGGAVGFRPSLHVLDGDYS